MTYDPGPWAAPAPPRRGFWWSLRHSAWLLAPILGLGLFSFVGFLYVAVRIRRSRLAWSAAAVSVVLTIVAWVLAFTTEDAEGKLPGGTSAFLVLLWLGSMVAAGLLDVVYLAWRSGAGRRPPGPQYPPPGFSPAPGFGPPPGGSVHGPGPSGRSGPDASPGPRAVAWRPHD